MDGIEQILATTRRKNLRGWNDSPIAALFYPRHHSRLTGKPGSHSSATPGFLRFPESKEVNAATTH
jgi:hypothetical protein